MVWRDGNADIGWCPKPRRLLIRIENADCFDFLPTVASDSVDLILTDPPYVISRATGFENGNDPAFDRLKVNMDYGAWDRDFSGMDRVIPEFYRILRHGGACIIFYDLWKITELSGYLKNAKFKQLRFLEWIKTNPVPLNQSVNYLTNAREIAVSAVKSGNPTFNSKYDNGIYNYPIEHTVGRFHPTQKSLRLMEDLILKHSNRGDLILDCFAGSGTTAMAAAKLERRFVGCEADSIYHQKSIERLRSYLEREHLELRH